MSASGRTSSAPGAHPALGGARRALTLLVLAASLGLGGCLVSFGVTNSPPMPGESRPSP